MVKYARCEEEGLTVGVSDGQTVKTSENGAIRGYAAGEQTKRSKCYIAVDTLGLMVGLSAPAYKS